MHPKYAPKAVQRLKGWTDDADMDVANHGEDGQPWTSSRHQTAAQRKARCCRRITIAQENNCSKTKEQITTVARRFSWVFFVVVVVVFFFFWLFQKGTLDLSSYKSPGVRNEPLTFTQVTSKHMYRARWAVPVVFQKHQKEGLVHLKSNHRSNTYSVFFLVVALGRYGRCSFTSAHRGTSIPLLVVLPTSARWVCCYCRVRRHVVINYSTDLNFH